MMPKTIGEQKDKCVHIVLPPQQIETRNLSSLDNKRKLAKALGGKVRMIMRKLRAKMEKSHSDNCHHCKNATIKQRIHPRYLELEPLCCVSSCLVRTGCCAAVVFELAFVAITAFVIGLKIYDEGRVDYWDKLDLNFNAIIIHPISLLLVALFDLLSLFMSFCLLYGIFTFERAFVKMHWQFDFFALGFNVIAFCLFFFALNSNGSETWTWKNIILVMAFASQIPLQLWTISVVKECYDFYVLLYVFVSLSER